MRKSKGKTKEIEFNTFDNTGPHNAVQFNKSLKNIADHLQLVHGNDVSEAVRNMAPVKIDITPAPQGESSGNMILPVLRWNSTFGKGTTQKPKTKKRSTTKT